MGEAAGVAVGRIIGFDRLSRADGLSGPADRGRYNPVPHRS